MPESATDIAKKLKARSAEGTIERSMVVPASFRVLRHGRYDADKAGNTDWEGATKSLYDG